MSAADLIECGLLLFCLGNQLRLEWQDRKNQVDSEDMARLQRHMLASQSVVELVTAKADRLQAECNRLQAELDARKEGGPYR